MTRRPDQDVSPAEAQNTGPFHQTPPAAPKQGEEPAASGPTTPIRPGGEPETSDDR